MSALAPVAGEVVRTARRAAMPTMVTSTYDVHNVCNLRCEGCSYFVTDRTVRHDRPSDDAYDAFFGAEAARGVNYPIFSGAEPSLNQRPLVIAARHWDNGAVFTNGTRRIDPELPFRVVVSFWGGRETTGRLRGGDTYLKALRTAAADKRAVILFTITKASIGDLPEVVADCANAGLQISFNLYSMSSEYARKLRDGERNDDQFFRFSTKDSNLSLSAADRFRIATLIDDLIERYPETVLFTKSLNEFMCRSESMFTIDPITHLATDCAALLNSNHLSFNYDLTRDERKDCISPDFDCRNCRVLGAALTTYLLGQGARARPSLQSLKELRRVMIRMYFWREPAGM